MPEAEDLANFFDDGFGGGQAAGAGHAAGQVAFIGIYYVDSTGAQSGEIFLRRRVLPHIYVHRGGYDYGSFRREVQGRKKIFGYAVREFSEDVGGGGRDEQQVNSLGDGYVFDGAFDVGGGGACGGEDVGDDFLSRERGEGQRSDEFLGGAGHYDLDVELFGLQAADQFGGFVGRDAAGYA